MDFAFAEKTGAPTHAGGVLIFQFFFHLEIIFEKFEKSECFFLQSEWVRIFL